MEERLEGRGHRDRERQGIDRELLLGTHMQWGATSGQVLHRRTGSEHTAKHRRHPRQQMLAVAEEEGPGGGHLRLTADESGAGDGKRPHQKGRGDGCHHTTNTIHSRNRSAHSVPDSLLNICPGVLMATGLGSDKQITLTTASGWDHLPAAGIDRSVDLTDRNELRQTEGPCVQGVCRYTARHAAAAVLDCRVDGSDGGRMTGREPGVPTPRACGAGQH